MLNYVYLAGPMSGISFDQANDWRVKARKTLPYWVQPLSPLRAKPYLTGSSVLGDHDNSQILCTEKAITDRDYNDVKRSSVVLVNFLESTTVSIGTVMEIAWAKALNIPCVLIIEKGNIHQHAMINASCGFFCTTLKEGIDTVAAITGNDAQVIEYQKKQQPVEIKQTVTCSDGYRAWDADTDFPKMIKRNKTVQERVEKYNKELMKFIKDNPVSYSSNHMNPLETLIETTIATDIYQSKTIEEKIKKFYDALKLHPTGKTINLLDKPIQSTVTEPIQKFKSAWFSPCATMKSNSQVTEQNETPTIHVNGETIELLHKPIEGTLKTKVYTRFPSDNVSSTGIDYNTFLNNQKFLSENLEAIRPTYTGKGARRVPDVKPPAPKEDRVLTFDELYNILLLETVIQDLDKELSSKK